MSKKARILSVSVSSGLDVGITLVPSPSDVHYMFSGSIEFRCSVNSSEYSRFRIVQVSSAYLFQNRGGWGVVAKARCSNASMYRLHTMGETGDPIAAPCICW